MNRNLYWVMAFLLIAGSCCRNSHYTDLEELSKTISSHEDSLNPHVFLLAKLPHIDHESLICRNLEIKNIADQKIRIEIMDFEGINPSARFYWDLAKNNLDSVQVVLNQDDQMIISSLKKAENLPVFLIDGENILKTNEVYYSKYIEFDCYQYSEGSFEPATVRASFFFNPIVLN